MNAPEVRKIYLDRSEGVHDFRLAIDVRVEDTKDVLKFLRKNQTHVGHVLFACSSGEKRIATEMNALDTSST